MSQPAPIEIADTRTERHKAGATEVDVNGLRQRVRSGLDDGDFCLLYLWIRFWANGGCAARADLEAFVQGLRELSNNDALVLRMVTEELHET